jgi:hypothetical protein
VVEGRKGDEEAEVREAVLWAGCAGDFAQVAIWPDGVVRHAGRFATTPEHVRAFADTLTPTDEVALDVTGNTSAIATLLASRAGRWWCRTRPRPARSLRRM